jgi:hypothetical protein
VCGSGCNASGIIKVVGRMSGSGSGNIPMAVAATVASHRHKALVAVVSGTGSDTSGKVAVAESQWQSGSGTKPHSIKNPRKILWIHISKLYISQNLNQNIIFKSPFLSKIFSKFDFASIETILKL